MDCRNYRIVYILLSEEEGTLRTDVIFDWVELPDLKVKKLEKRGNPSPDAPSRSTRNRKARSDPQEIQLTHVIREDKQ